MFREPTPIPAQERIDYLDVVRGLAIFGILITNIAWFSLYSPDRQGPFHVAFLDGKVRFLQHVFIEGKFYTIFSILFGWGIALQLKRLEKKGSHGIRLIHRRLLFMMLLGGIHLMLIWEGDIVFFYALVGFVLVALRNLSNRSLLLTAILLFVLPVFLYGLRLKIPAAASPILHLTNLGEFLYRLNGWTSQDLDRTRVLMESKSILAVFRNTLSDVPYRFANLMFASRGANVLGAMLLGYVAGRNDWYPKVVARKRELYRPTLVLLLISLVLNVLLAVFLENPQAAFTWTRSGLFTSFVFALAVVPLAIAYMLLLAFLLDHRKLRRFLFPLIPVGKMAFSNYVFQSLLGMVLFYGVGFGLAQQFGTLSLSILAAVVFIFQMIFSAIWLRYFRFGPIEYIWRSLTYGKSQPFRKVT